MKENLNDKINMQLQNVYKLTREMLSIATSLSVKEFKQIKFHFYFICLKIGTVIL